jgi:predicted transcriptional regulator
MTKKQEFINYIENLIKDKEMPENVKIYWDTLKSEKVQKDKPMFTDNGKIVLDYMQKNAAAGSWSAKSIAEGVLMSGRGVSGTLRKLVTDGFVEKLSEDPIIYALTTKGKEIEIN